MLKILQTLAVEFHIFVCNFSREILVGTKRNSHGQMGRKYGFTAIIQQSDINTVISHAVAYSSKWRREP